MMRADSEELLEVLASLPGPQADLFRRLAMHEEFEVRPLRSQIAVHYRGGKVGGYNRTEKHWYFSKVFVATDHQREIAGRLLDIREHPLGHFHWIAKGLGATARFEAVLVQLIGEEVR